MSEAQSTAVMSLEDRIKQQLAVQGQKAAEMQTKANLISFKGGQLIVDGAAIPNGEAQVIVLAQQVERTYYSKPFNPGAVTVPDCYSFDLIAPHPEATNPQCDTCEACPQNKWNTAHQGRGKACRESTRVALQPASAPIDTAPMYQCSFPITSMSSVKEFFARCATSGKLSCEFKTLLKVVPDAKLFFKASLSILELLPAAQEQLGTLLDRMEKARAQLLEPYPVLDDEAAAPETPKTKAGKAKY